MIRLPDIRQPSAKEVFASLYGGQSILACVTPESAMRVLSPGMEAHPWLTYYSINAPRNVSLKVGLRSHENLQELNHFVFESDSLTIEQQLEVLESKAEMIALAVFSGNKSIHFHVVTEKKPATVSDYKVIYQSIGTRLFTGELTGCYDPQCCEPARLTRIPNGVNAKTGLRQKVLHFDPARIVRDDFSAALASAQSEKRNKESRELHLENSNQKKPQLKYDRDDPAIFKKYQCPLDPLFEFGVAVLDGRYEEGAGHNDLMRGLLCLYRFKLYDEFVYSEDFIMKIAVNFPRKDKADNRNVAEWVIALGRE